MSIFPLSKLNWEHHISDSKREPFEEDKYYYICYEEHIEGKWVWNIVLVYASKENEGDFENPKSDYIDLLLHNPFGELLFEYWLDMDFYYCQVLEVEDK